MLIERLMKLALLGSEWVLYLLLALSVLSISTMVERTFYFFRRRVEHRGQHPLMSGSRCARQAEHACGHLVGVAVAHCVSQRLPGDAGQPRGVDQRQPVLAFGDLEDGSGQRHGANHGQHL